VLRLECITKTFGGLTALRDVTLDVRAGEVHALCGENGAGKSTLMNILTGHLQPDAGTLFWHDAPLSIRSVAEARRLGIGIVYQERSLVDALSVAENVFPEHPPRTRLGLIDFPRLERQTQAWLDRLRLPISPRVPVGRLPVPQQQMVELAKALATEPRLLLLDEPTASLTDAETAVLFDLIRQLRAEGVAVVYISHRMAEITAIADRVSVLKDGVYQGTFPGDTPAGVLIRAMVGRELRQQRRASRAGAEVVLEARHLSGRGFRDVSFQLRRGEILGLAGLVGAGRSELARTLLGDLPAQAGTLHRAGAPYHPQHPADALARGLAYVPDDRKRVGLFLEKTVAENLAPARLRRGWYRASDVVRAAEGYVRQLGIRTPSVRQAVGRLSGGNQQKVVLARALDTAPDVLIVDEPTHGVDVGAKAEIYELLDQLTARGVAILLISSELPELRQLADRIAVLRAGAWVAELDGTAPEEEILRWAAT
jgi:ABC-type sugar transport system ATPase subunit